VDRHVHKAREAVDEDKETTRRLWRAAQASLTSRATRAVENHARMWTTKLENSWK
jgi:hypothetical protein